MNDINLKKLLDRLDEIENQMSAYAIGLQNVYLEFEKYSI